MRVAFFVNRFPVASEPFIATSAAALIASGHDVEIFGFGGGLSSELTVDTQTAGYLRGRAHNIPTPDTLVSHVSTAPGALARAVSASGLRAFGALNPFVHRRSLLNLTSLYQASVLPKNRDYDILHCQFATLGEYVLKHKRAGLLKGNIIVHFRGYDISQVVQSCGPKVYDSLFSEAQYFIANCDYFRQRAISLGCDPSRIAVVGSGVDFKNFPYRSPRQTAGATVRFATVGRLIERKGVHIALRALARLYEQGKDFRFDVIGDGDQRQHLKYLARELGIASRVTFHGTRSHDEIKVILDASHIFLATSLTSSDGGVDAIVNTVKEAMAVGVPVVGTDHGGIPELVEEGRTGTLARENDPEALFKAIVRLLALEPQWTELAVEARRRVEATFSIDSTNKKLLNIYENVCG